jgi:hypothetical protein
VNESLKEVDMNSCQLSNTVAPIRRVALAVALSILSIVVSIYSRDVVLTVNGTAGKLRTLAHDAEAFVRYSQRLYRFYKLATETPVVQARCAN